MTDDQLRTSGIMAPSSVAMLRAHARMAGTYKRTLRTAAKCLTSTIHSTIWLPRTAAVKEVMTSSRATAPTLQPTPTPAAPTTTAVRPVRPTLKYYTGVKEHMLKNLRDACSFLVSAQPTFFSMAM
jgi:predicted metal-binding membrane protein